MHLPLSSNFIQRVITSLVLGFLFWAIFIYLPPAYFSATLIGILCCIIIFEWKRFFAITTPLFWLTLPIYPTLPFVLLIKMNNNPSVRPLLFILFILVFSFDTGSYIVGTLCGKRKIAPIISAKKTWEGLLGGYIFAVGGLWMILYEHHITKPFTFILFFTGVVCILSFFGDLFESWLKRRAHIKDSGTLLPGHGGFLDRFDGIMFTVFFFYFFREILLQVFYHVRSF